MNEENKVSEHYRVLAESASVLALEPSQILEVARRREGKRLEDVAKALSLGEGDVGGASYDELIGMMADALFEVVEIDTSVSIPEYRARVDRL